jgi:methionyl-tRNA synthetase
LSKSVESREALEGVLGALIRALARQCVMLHPFIPGKAQEAWTQIGGPGLLDDRRLDALKTIDATGWRVKKGAPLFPKPA